MSDTIHIQLMKGGEIEMNYYSQECCYESECHSGRNFFTREEKVEMLKSYKEKLDNESKGVAERIEQLEKHKHGDDD